MLYHVFYFILFRTKVLRTKYEGYIIPLQKKPALLKNPTEGLYYSCIKQHLVSHCIWTYLGSHKNEPFWKITFSVGSTHLQHRIDNYFVLKTIDSFLFQFLQSKLRGARKKWEAQGKVARTVKATLKKKKKRLKNGVTNVTKSRFHKKSYLVGRDKEFFW